jgi:hypothetical protein
MIIGICGRAGSGKDTAADYLVSKYGFVKLSFAATLKNMLAVAGLPEPANRDDKEKIIDGFTFSWREAAQKLGTEFGRELDPDIWVKLTAKVINPTVNYVISDVRFENEAKMVREHGFLLHLEGRQVNLGSNSGHASEQGVLQGLNDWRIVNDGSINKLYLDILHMIESMHTGFMLDSKEGGLYPANLVSNIKL